MSHRILPIILTLLIFNVNILAQNIGGVRSVRLGVVLPLKEKSSRGTKMVEFYQGVLMAVDSLKHEGINIHVQALHSGSTAAEMDDIVFSRRIKDCDVIFGPLDNAQLPALADYCDLHNTHLVVPFTSLANQVPNHQRHYLINAPRLIVQREAVWYIRNHFSEYNVVLVECNEDNNEGKEFGNLLNNSLNQNGVYVRSVNMNGDDSSFFMALNSMRKNLIVLNSSSLKAINQILPRLKNFKREHPEYEFSLFGYPAWQTYTQQLLSDFYEFDTYVFTNFYRNPLSTRSDAIDRQYMAWFHTPMSATFPRYALMGFDIANYFIRGIAIYGRDGFTANIKNIPALPYQHPLYFEQESESDGFINTFVELIHYSPNLSIELITRNH